MNADWKKDAELLVCGQLLSLKKTEILENRVPCSVIAACAVGAFLRENPSLEDRLTDEEKADVALAVQSACAVEKAIEQEATENTKENADA